MTIQPFPTVESAAEQRQAPDPQDTWRHPLPPDWCYLCACVHSGETPPYHLDTNLHPRSLSVAGDFLAYRAMEAACLPLEPNDWCAGDVALARAIAASMANWADWAERIAADRSAQPLG